MPASGEIAGWLAVAVLAALWVAWVALLAHLAFGALSRLARRGPLPRLSAADRRWLAALHVKWNL